MLVDARLYEQDWTLREVCSADEFTEVAEILERIQLFCPVEHKAMRGDGSGKSGGHFRFRECRVRGGRDGYPDGEHDVRGSRTPDFVLGDVRGRPRVSGEHGVRQGVRHSAGVRVVAGLRGGTLYPRGWEDCFGNFAPVME